MFSYSNRSIKAIQKLIALRGLFIFLKLFYFPLFSQGIWEMDGFGFVWRMNAAHFVRSF